MVPVALRLTNFLSYGTAAPALDFDMFHVACLSGRNGQGKSALLDAITWALWGEARKSSGNRKPDEELLRIGTRQMEVELVFDLEGERYRVTRSYMRSASGKTSKPGLELHLYEPTAEEYRPLTSTGVRETQQHIERLLGIDYDTFINSAFLLQGRSDEFTKKNPSDRKEILARILNLSRFERLADLARTRERDALERLRTAEAEIDRLKEALEPEPTWKEERSRVEAARAERRQELEGLRGEEQRLTERLAALDALAREREAAQSALAGLRDRIEGHEEDVQKLRARIGEAEALIAQKDEIERDHDRYEALQRERDTLDTKSVLHRGIEKQIESREAELKDRKNDLEKRLHSLEVELKADRGARSECEAQLAELPSVRRKLESARAAAQQFEKMDAVRRKRQELEGEVEGIERELLGQREALTGQWQALLEEVRRGAAALPVRSKLEERRDGLKEAHTKLEGLREELEATRVKGQDVAETLREHAGKHGARKQALAEEEENRARFRSAADGVCPTCGTELSPTHREEVEAHYARAVETLQKELCGIETAMERWKEERDALRVRFRTLQGKVDGLAGVPEQLASVEADLRAYHEAREQLDARRAEAEAIEKRIEAKEYGGELRERRRALKERLSALAFDADAFEEVRAQAAQVVRFEEQLRSLEGVSGRRDGLDRSIRTKEEQAERLRTQLDDGSVFGPLQEQVQNLQRQLAEVGFDPQRLEQVKGELQKLAGAGARLKDLVHAQQNQVAWKEDVTRIEQRLEKDRAERQRLVAKMAEMERTLEARPAVQQEQQTLAEKRAGLEATLRGLQEQVGELSARLEGAARDRAALKLRRKERAEAKSERTLYKHLRGAFGKHGIPSLIIEQTLPEIEERANDLLERLTDGKMHVRLETLKDKKTGGTKETLEIIITDEQGVPRAYETFSGGEAFRVNFALRIALAQLLAERSGVRIRTLVIDEGFGTQDAQGVQNMVEAIQVVQQDFDKIVVITHLEELKEAFPIRIEVEKDPVEGSSFEVLGV